MSGYFFLASKPGGLMIQPWIFMPSFVGYQNSSTWPNVLPARMSSLTAVSCRSTGFFTFSATTSLGLSDVDATPTISPLLLIDVTLSSCDPFVIGLTPPASGEKYRLRQPSLSTL